MTGDNGVPDTPDWCSPPRCWPEHGARCDSCDVCNPRSIPDNIILGAE